MALKNELLARAAGPSRRRFTLVEINSPEDLRWLEPRSKYFGLMTAIDLNGMPEVVLRNAAEDLIHRGLAYLDAWGIDCERWHDAVDRADVDRLTALGVYPDGDWDPVMTVWHKNESLEDSVWDFRYVGFAAGRYEEDCRDAILAATPRHLEDSRRAFIMRHPLAESRRPAEAGLFAVSWVA